MAQVVQTLIHLGNDDLPSVTITNEGLTVEVVIDAGDESVKIAAPVWVFDAWLAALNHDFLSVPVTSKPAGWVA